MHFQTPKLLLASYQNRAVTVGGGPQPWHLAASKALMKASLSGSKVFNPYNSDVL